MTAAGCLMGDLPVRLAPTYKGELTSAENAWANDEAGSGFNRPLTGAVDFSTGFAQFQMWATASHTSAMLFVGTLGTDGALTGTVTDPMSGYDPIFHLSGSPDCSVELTGHRR
jgi:hypothetical protein